MTWANNDMQPASLPYGTPRRAVSGACWGCGVVKVIDIPLNEALAVPKRVDLNGDGLLTARPGDFFGDE
jgi:hypothetical protein